MGAINLSGISGSRTAAVCSKFINEKKGQSIIVVANENRAQKLVSDLSFFVEKKIYTLSSEDDTFAFYEAKNREPIEKRLRVMKALSNKEECVIVIPIFTAIKKLIPKTVFENNHLDFRLSKEMNVGDISKKLVDMGYERVSMIYAKGQFAVRGSIVDIFTPYDDEPYRIEFFDIEVESIRTFDVETQRSIEKLEEIKIFPAMPIIRDHQAFVRAENKIEIRYDKLVDRKKELIDEISSLKNSQLLEYYMEYFYENPETIVDYMEDPLVILDDPVRMEEAIEARSIEYSGDFRELLTKGKVVKEDFDAFPKLEDYQRLYKARELYVCTPFEAKTDEIKKFDEVRDIKIREPLNFNGQMDIFAREMRKYIADGYSISIVASTEVRRENIGDFLSREEITGKIEIRNGMLSHGMDFVEEKHLLLSDSDIFGHQKIAARIGRKSKKSKPIKAFTEIAPGDFVVHENHGIGKFLGIKQLELQGVKKDYIHIQYAGDDVLYVPVENMNLVQKYVGAEAATPRIYRLSGSEWKKTKKKIKEAVAEMAKELIEISAARKAEQGHSFGEDTVWQKEFEDAFLYEETEDQIRCIEEIKTDMEKPEIMDRLLCGDVGYGKTEVAARGMFKAAAEGKQVAMIVPTTILANQHYTTLKERFEKFPFKVEMLSRFKTQKEQKKIIEELKEGKIDVIVGTHRLFSEDIEFKDLGLLIIDEEQRFGVAHKEKIKKLKKNVDVLALSATPIPRTLHMSLAGIRDMSIIEEPPQDRIPVQTYVMEEDDHIIREAIERETGRGGQVFIIYNRVRGIVKLAKRIQELVPDKKILIGHGQMGEHQLEDVMIDFIQGKADVLIATTIIESGIDIPNANTEIIIDADKFGLSQLYQLRGRVGRSSQLAYAYLMHRRDKVLNEVAEKRLRAIKEFTEFGAGFKVAMRDLEIRGAGNLLGAEQHGHMVSVGYELYCKMIDEAVAALKGNIIRDDALEILIDIKVPAYIPGHYISDESVKLSVYKEISNIQSRKDIKELTEELDDRFGNIPKEVANLMKVALIKALAEDIGINKVQEKNEKLIFQYDNKALTPMVIYKRAGVDVLNDVVEFMISFNKKI